MIVSNIQTDINASKEDLENAIAKAAGFNPYDYKIKRKAIDSRHRKINYVYTVEVLKNETDSFDEYKPEIKKIKLKHRPVIVGAGPSGLFCGYILALSGARPIILERGKSVDERKADVENFWNKGILNSESNVQFGEGGAGNFSDGKLMSGIKDSLIQFMSDIFIKFGANEEISYVAKPHIGTDELVKIVKNFRTEIEKLGGTFVFNSKFTDFELHKDNSISVYADKEYITDDLILAIGHSAYDTFQKLLSKGVSIQPKPFSVGMRIEHLQKDINISRYGNNLFTETLGAADYKLSYKTHKNRGVYTFCMCPGGVVIASSSEENGIVTNGMSYSKRDLVNSNSALLVEIGIEDYYKSNPLSGFDFQRKIEHDAFLMGGMNYKAPCQLLGDYQSGRISNSFGEIEPTYKLGVTFCDLNKLFPDYVNDSINEAVPEFNRKLKGFNNPFAVLTAPETRTSSPVKIPRDDDFNCNIKGIYPIGEGAGHAGGITSSAIDGIKCALKIINKYL